MSTSRKLVVEVVGDSSKLTRTLKQTETQTTKFAKKLEGVGTGTRGGLGSASALLKGGGLAIGAGLAAKQISSLSIAASDLNEQISKSKAIFGQSSKAVEDWSKTTASAIGVSRTEALAATGTFGNLFDTVGIAGSKAAGMSQALVQLAADLASFNNASPTDTLDAIRSGLIGEAEPLRRFGVLLSEARVQQQAMADTGKKTAAALTDQEKALARYEIILSDTGKAQGDFDRTSEGLANQQRILKARLADTRAELGTKLLPIMLKATEAANKFLGAFQTAQASVTDFSNPDFLKKFQDAFGIEALVDALNAMAPQIRAAREQFERDVESLGARIDPFNQNKPKPPPAFGQPGFKPGTAPKVPTTTASQRNRFFDDALARDLDRVQDSELRAQVTKLRAIEKTISDRIAATKDITRKLNLEDDLVSVRRQRRSVEQQISDQLTQRLDDAKAAKIEAKAKALEDLRKRQEAALAKLQTRQFRALGLGASGGDIVPGVANLRTQFASLTDRLGTDPALSSKLKSQFDGVGKVLSGSLGKVTEESRSAIVELFETIRGTFDKESSKTKGPLTKTTSLNTNSVLAGLGLSPADERELRARLSKFNSAGIAISSRPGTAGGFGVAAGAPRDTVVHTTINLDGAKVATNTTRHQQTRRRRNPPQKRGRESG
jgi:hypothetical protein